MMSCDNVITVQELETDKKHSTYYREVITGKSGGTGDDIDFATNAVTGQTQTTLSKILSDAESEFDQVARDAESEFERVIGGMGYARVGTFKAGATLTTARQTVLWDIADGGDGQEYGWGGVFPKVVPANSAPDSTGGVGASKWVSRFDPALRNYVLNTTTATFKNETGYSAAENMVAGRINGVAGAVSHQIGNIYSTGGTSWRCDVTSPSTLNDFTPLGVVSVNDFGANGDYYLHNGSANPNPTDNTNYLQACLDWCMGNNAAWYIPNGHYFVPSETLKIYTSGTCDGVIVGTNSSSANPVIEIACDPADIDNVPVSDLASWGGLQKGQLRAQNASGLRDYMYFVQTSDPWIVRLTAGGTFNKYHAMRFTTDNGDFVPEAMVNVPHGVISAVTRKKIRPRISINGLTVKVVGATGERAGGVMISRPNTELVSPFIDNVSSAPIMQGIYTHQTCMVDVVRGVVSGVGVSVTNYAYTGGAWSFDVTFTHCREMYSRRGIDIQNGQDVSVVGGSFPSGVGGHWVHGLKISNGATIAANSSINPNPIHVAGSYISVSGCKLMANSGAAFLNMREDLPELGGAIHLENNTYVLDCSVSALAEYSIIDISFGSGSGYNANRRVAMPSSIVINGGTFMLLHNGDPASVFDLYAVKSSWADTVAKSTFGATYNMQVSIDGIACDFGAIGNNKLPENRPRLGVIYNKGHDLAGDGATFTVSNVKSFRVFASAAAYNLDTTAKRAVARADFFFENIGTVSASVADGACRWITCKNVSLFSRTKPTGSTSFTPVGDEKLIGQSDLFAGLDVVSKSALPPNAVGRLCYVSDAAGGAKVAVSDGTYWRSVVDSTIIS